MNWYCHYGNQDKNSSKKIKIDLPHNLAIVVWVLYPNDCKPEQQKYLDIHVSSVYSCQDIESA